MLFTSYNIPYITLRNEQCLKLLLGVCNTKKRDDLSISLGLLQGKRGRFKYYNGIHSKTTAGRRTAGTAATTVLYTSFQYQGGGPGQTRGIRSI